VYPHFMPHDLVANGKLLRCVAIFEGTLSSLTSHAVSVYCRFSEQSSMYSRVSHVNHNEYLEISSRDYATRSAILNKAAECHHYQPTW
jgi:hypothetical protein